MQWFDYLRLVTAFVSAIGLYRIWKMIRVPERRKGYTSRLKDIIWFVAASLVLFVVGSLEAIADDAPYGQRLWLSLLVALVGIRATRWSDEPLQTLPQK